jgi:hypothetical protein
MSKIKGLAIRAAGEGAGGSEPECGPRNGGQRSGRHQILGDIFRRMRDTQGVTQYQFNRIPFRNWGRVEERLNPNA